MIILLRYLKLLKMLLMFGDNKFPKKWIILFKSVNYLFPHQIYIHKYFILYYKILQIQSLTILLKTNYQIITIKNKIKNKDLFNHHLIQLN